MNLIKKSFYFYKVSNNFLVKLNFFLTPKYLLINSHLQLFSKLIDYQNQSNFVYKMNIKHVFLSKKSNKYIFDNSMSKKAERLFFVLCFLKQAFLSKTFIKGQIYRFFKKGFIVSLNGFVSFLSLNNCSFLNFIIGNLNIFFVSSFNENKTKTIMLSQRKIYRKIHKILLKMASRLVILKTNGRCNSIG